MLTVVMAFALLLPASADTGLVPGKRISGFTLTEMGKCDIYNADTYLFTHDKTGGKVLYIANADTNRAFDIAFRTPAEDTGVTHVFEHATLNGSEKYPANLLFNVSYETINTYINAATSIKYTYYPISSISEPQLFRLADYYLDGVFNPLIMTDQDIFDQEAWRYELTSPEDDLQLNGTVYSEMKGGLSPENKAAFNALKLLYPGSCTAAQTATLVKSVMFVWSNTDRRDLASKAPSKAL